MPFSFVAGSSTKLDVTSSPCSGVRGTRLPKALEGFDCSLLKRSLVHFSLKGFGIRLLRSAHVNFFPRLRAASPSSSLLRERRSFKAGTISLHLPLSFPRLQCKIFSFFAAICSTSLSIPKPQFSLFKITPKRTGLPFMCAGTKWRKRFIEVNLCTIEFFLREICNY